MEILKQNIKQARKIYHSIPRANLFYKKWAKENYQEAKKLILI